MDADWLEIRSAVERLPGLTRRRQQVASAAVLATAAGAAALAIGRSTLGVSLFVAAAFGVAYVWLLEHEREAVLTRVVASGFVDATPEAVRFGWQLVSPPPPRRLPQGVALAAAARRPRPHQVAVLPPPRAPAGRPPPQRPGGRL